MIDPIYIYSDTPLSNGSRTRDANALGGELGRDNLPQCRVRFERDMAHAAILAEKEEFGDAFFPLQNTSSSAAGRPQLNTNPFADLAAADNMMEADVRALFVSVSTMDQVDATVI